MSVTSTLIDLGWALWDFCCRWAVHLIMIGTVIATCLAVGCVFEAARTATT